MSFRSRRAFVILVAVLGIVLAVAVTWATSQIVSQRIGLSSEPVTAGLRLLPAPRRQAGATTTTRTAPPPRAPATPAPAPGTTAPVPAPAPTTGAAPEPEPGEGRAGGEGDRAKSGDD